MFDLYTIRKAFGKIDGLRIGILGDLKYGRTASSLSYGLSNYDVEITFVAPESLTTRKEIDHFLSERGGGFTEAEGGQGRRRVAGRPVRHEDTEGAHTRPN